MNVKSKFCPAPWYHLSTDTNGSLRPCCKFSQPQLHQKHKMPFMYEGRLDELWNSKNFKSLRQDFIDGKQPKECEICWNEENNNVRSYRENLIDWFKSSWEHCDFTNVEAPPPTSFDFKVTNLCNMKCRICGPTASSLFFEEAKSYMRLTYNEAYLKDNKITQTNNREIFLKWLPHIKRIEITGGEPLVSPENKEMIKLICDQGHADHIDLQVTTNGKLFIPKFNEYLKQFERVIISLSIDDITDRFEYHRYPSNWKKVKSNIDDYIKLDKDNHNIQTYLYCTVSNYNIFYLDEYCDYFSYLPKNQYNFGLLFYNDYWCIQNLHPYIKEIILDKLSDYEKLHPVINFLSGKGKDLTKKFLIETSKFDRLRQQQFSTTFPEWYDILSMHRTL